MNRPVFVALLALATITLAQVAAQAQDASPSPAASPTLTGEFELKIDQVQYDVTEGQPFEIKLHSGEKVTGLLTRKRARTYKGEGITFDYSPDFKLSTEKDGDLVTISLDHQRSPMAMIQLFPPEVKADDVPTELLDGIRKEFKEKSATIVKEPYAVQRDFKSGKHTGQGVMYKIAGQQIEVEIYGWSAGKRTYAVTLQWATEEGDLAKEAFGPIVSSFDATQ